MILVMNNIKISAYGGLLKVTKSQYIKLQFFVFLVLIGAFILSYKYNLDQYMFGNAKIFIIIVAICEIIEMIYIFRKFND